MAWPKGKKRGPRKRASLPFPGVMPGTKLFEDVSEEVLRAEEDSEKITQITQITLSGKIENHRYGRRRIAAAANREKNKKNS